MVATANAAGASAAVLYESATIGPVGREGGVSVASQFVGGRFHLDTTVVVGAVGGHLGRSTGTMFATIVRLGGTFPRGAPLADGEVFASTTFDAGFPSSDVRVPLSVTLPAGDYALVFGSTLFGASGTGFMPSNNADRAGASYFFWNPATGRWAAEATGRLRFVLEGEPCASCPTPAVMWTPPPQAATGVSRTSTPAVRTATPTAPTPTPAAPTETPSESIETPNVTDSSGLPTATPQEPVVTATPAAPTANGTVVTTPGPSPGTPEIELPLLRKSARKCQSAMASQSRSFGHALHSAVQRCFDRMLKDSADGRGTLTAVQGCAATLDLTNPASKLARRRAKVLSQITRRCAGLVPGDVGSPCSATASTIAETAVCLVESYTARVGEEIADTYHDACMLLEKASVPDVLPAACASDD